ncbi:MAG: polysaccharide deacetylase family protein [Terracidiphilus sp.]|jgi:peptidoglycan/xylan/chitin deacetylase (PgdA/CDA1 family)
MKMRTLVAGFVFAVAAGAAGQSSHLPEPVSGQALTDTFASLREQWARNLHDKRIDASVAEYAADAEFIDPIGNRVLGSGALRKLFETVTATYDSNLAFDSQRVEVSGDLGYDSGTYKELLTTRATGKGQQMRGGYLTVYRHEKNGEWLIVEQMWTGAGDVAAGIPAPDAQPVVALTFDDLPAAGILPQGENRTKIATALATALKANHLEGTYGFVNAVRLENDPDAQQALHIWVDAGMNIGNHTWSHMSLTGNTVEAYEQEVARNEPALAQYGEVRDWRWFRYPFLTEGETLEKRHAIRNYLREHGYRVAQVTLSFEDYAWNDAYARCSVKPDDAAIAWLRQSYLEAATESIRLGREEERIAFGREIPNVMLLHATAFTTLMLPDLVDLLRKQGFRFAALAEVEADAAYGLDPDAALQYGGTLPDQFVESRKLPYPAFKPNPVDQLNNLCK